MNGLTKLGTVLTAVFLVSLVALVAELLYVLWRKQIFRRRSRPQLPADPFYNMTPSKEQLLYFFCLKNQSRIEPAGNPPVPAPHGAEGGLVLVDDDEVEKWQHEMYGTSRVLFTIKEEEREGAEASEAENDQAKNETGFVEVESESLSGVVVKIEAVDYEEATPFSTPCASPPYYTPSPSPTHDKWSTGSAEVVMSKGEKDMSFVSLEVSSE